MKNETMKNKKTEGFTLVEVLIVIAILAILVAILLPKFSKFTLTSKEKAVMTNAHNLQLAMEAYFSTNSTYPTGANMAAVAAVLTANSNGGPYLGAIPINPFTNTAYASTDTSGQPGGITVGQTGGTTGPYTITSYGAAGTNAINTITQ